MNGLSLCFDRIQPPGDRLITKCFQKKTRCPSQRMLAIFPKSKEFWTIIKWIARGHLEPGVVAVEAALRGSDFVQKARKRGFYIQLEVREAE